MSNNWIKDIMKLKLYLLEQNQNRGYETYDSCVVVAENPEEARKIHPSGDSNSKYGHYTWADKPDSVFVTLVGSASSKLKKGTVICSSFNAG